MRRIDYEETPSLNFTVVAYDSGVPQLSASALVFVKVININDMDPIFNQVCMWTFTLHLHIYSFVKHFWVTVGVKNIIVKKFNLKWSYILNIQPEKDQKKTYLCVFLLHMIELYSVPNQIS